MKRSLLIIAVLLISAAMLFTGCKKASSPSMDRYDAESKNIGHFNGNIDYAAEAPVTTMMPSDPSGSDGSDVPSGQNDVFAGRKVIRNAELDIETLEFDNCVKAITAKALALGGYIQSNNVSSRGYYYGDLRYAATVVRVPADKLDEFLSAVDGYGNITSRSEKVDDITDTYIDMDARLRSLRTEYDTLLGLLEKADSLENILVLQERLSEVRYEIESYEARLRSYDNLVAYSTVSMDIREVSRETVVEKETFGGEVSRRFKESLEDVIDGFRVFAAWLLGEFPRILMWLIFAVALPIVIVVIIVKSIKKGKAKRKAKKELKEAEEAAKRRAAYDAALEAEKAKLE